MADVKGVPAHRKLKIVASHPPPPLLRHFCKLVKRKLQKKKNTFFANVTKFKRDRTLCNSLNRFVRREQFKKYRMRFWKQKNSSAPLIKTTDCSVVSIFSAQEINAGAGTAVICMPELQLSGLCTVRIPPLLSENI
jgi:hypothetical protein